MFSYFNKLMVYRLYKDECIWRWKNSGIVCDDYELLYERYINTKFCEKCNCKLVSGNFGSNKKAIDHNHITGEVRFICCHSCNMNDKLKYRNNTSGHKNIRYNKRFNNYKYEKQIKGNKIIKQFKSKKDALCYKFIVLLMLQAKIPVTVLSFK
jgi:hypothetical protein